MITESQGKSLGFKFKIDFRKQNEQHSFRGQKHCKKIF
jgi:hypothetical protein